MKKLVSIFFMCMMMLTASAQKQAILLVQFGTSNDEGRTAALDVMLQEVKNRYADFEVREAYTSPTIRKVLAKKGIKKDSATDALLRLHLDGYEQVFVMPTFLLDGVEMNMLRNEVHDVAHFFKEVKVGNPVMYKLSDFHKVVEVLTEQVPDKNQLTLFVGHGNEYASTGAYTMLGQMVQEKGNFMVGTIEGWPDLETSVGMVNPKKFKKVKVVPLLLAAGVHVREDIDGEWKPALEAKGLGVEVSYHGLGESPTFREIIFNHLAELLK